MELTVTEARRAELIKGVLAGRIGVVDAARLLGRSERSVYRMMCKVMVGGEEGLAHGNRGRRSPRLLDEAKRKQILDFAVKKYAGFNDCHLLEMLAGFEGIHLGRETLRGLLRESGIGPKKKRRGRVRRTRREPKEAFGMMLQIDASLHDWLEGRGPRMTLVGVKDDATGYVWALFRKAETTHAYFDLMKQVFASHGLPLSLYSDRHTIFHSTKEPTIAEQLADRLRLTQFGRAMNDLGVQVIKAWSPQAKGRIERQWGIFQDRLVAEMRLHGISNMDDANAFLKTFLARYNSSFAKTPRVPTAVFMKAPDKPTLDRILCPPGGTVGQEGPHHLIRRRHPPTAPVFQIPGTGRWQGPGAPTLGWLSGNPLPRRTHCGLLRRGHEEAHPHQCQGQSLEGRLMIPPTDILLRHLTDRLTRK